jgi:hypothetical protein
MLRTTNRRKVPLRGITFGDGSFVPLAIQYSTTSIANSVGNFADGTLGMSLGDYLPRPATDADADADATRVQSGKHDTNDGTANYLTANNAQYVGRRLRAAGVLCSSSLIVLTGCNVGNSRDEYDAMLPNGSRRAARAECWLAAGSDTGTSK